MNYKMIRFVISWVLKVEGMLMLLPALVGAMYQEKTGFAYLIWGLHCGRSDPLLQKTVQYGNLFPRRICLRFVKLGCPWCFRSGAVCNYGGNSVLYQCAV